MTTLNSTSILALIIAQNPYHIISIQGQMPMSHAQNTYDFEIAEDDPHYDDMVNYSGDMLWVYLSKPREPRRTPRTRRHKPKDITNKGTRNILYRN